MRTLNIDIETFSSVDIGKSGAYKYAMSDDFQILLFAYSVDGQDVKIVDLAQGEVIPQEVLDLLKDEACIKYAYNAVFEWWCLNMAGIETPLEQWQCTMVHGLYCGYTAGLAAIGNAMGLPQDKKKLTTGSALIRYFCVPCKATKSNGNRTRNLPQHAPEKWQLFKEYCMQDVVTEMEIGRRLSCFPVPEREWNLWVLDTFMNAYGVRVDSDLVNGALFIDAASRAKLLEEARDITKLDNPNSTSQLLSWLEEAGEEVENLQKATVEKMVDTLEDGQAKRVLEIRQELSKTSVKKYKAMDEAMCKDGRVRGLLQFYGANRTGRYAGRLVQVQNLPRNYIETLDIARDVIKKGDGELLEMLYGNISDTLSQLIRTAFIPSEGNHFVVSDFSLALGYQGSVGALTAMGAADMGLTDEEMKDIVDRWRKSSKRIVELWYALENAAVEVLETGEPQVVKCVKLAKEYDFIYGQDFFTIELPSGRKLFYPKPFLKENQFGQMQMHYMGINQTSKKWEVIPTYGGKLTENIVQAIARDCLAETLLRVKDKGWPIVFHVHDEVILDVPTSVQLDEVIKTMTEEISWAKGLILNAAGFTGSYYMKD